MRQEADGNTLAAAFLNDALQSEVVALFCNADPLKCASAGFQRFSDGVEAIDVTDLSRSEVDQNSK